MSHKLPLALLLAATLSACSPKYDWRDYRSNDAPYAVLFPAKPATQTRSIKLDQLDVNMTMSAADIDGVVFAVGSAQLADAAQAPAAVEAMKAAMVNNIHGTVTRSTPQEIDASGSNMRLIGRFLSKDRRIYQVVVIGSPQKIEAESVDTFFSSFKLH
ncbi:hypothetical protein GJ699_33600 [Duganella sp. FT80W]|uniref:Transmembrane protein n=1 Tax=Duganella guangzhouensis TaxID=2666084 RepID=A0A6I2L9F0_9BURK|nr:hypothetical protein [Duganella guangzhouensis]MRW94895.1 hypothetical protein [Duganella guangzhouensis]